MDKAPVNLKEYETCAQAMLDAAAWAYFSGGAADEITLRQNLQAWQDIALAPRVLQRLNHSHTRIELLGREWPTPLLVAPMAHQRWAHADGEAGMALAAAAQGCGMVLSHQTSTPLQTVARLVRDDVSNAAFPFGTSREIEIGYSRVTALRVTYVGELGFELLIPSDQARSVWRVLEDAGGDLGFRPVGLAAMHGLRLEKAYRDYGLDMDNSDTPLDVGLDFTISWDKPGGFIGRDVLVALRDEGYLDLTGEEPTTGYPKKLYTATYAPPAAGFFEEPKQPVAAAHVGQPPAAPQPAAPAAQPAPAGVPAGVDPQAWAAFQAMQAQAAQSAPAAPPLDATNAAYAAQMGFQAPQQ